MESKNFLIIEIEDKFTLNISNEQSLRALTFSYVDDISYLCDMAEIEFNVPYGITSDGFESKDFQIPPLTGTEKVNIIFGNDISKKDGRIEVEMDIFKIREKPGSPSANYNSVVITLVNSKLKNFIGTVKNRSFQGSYSDVARKLAKEAEIKKKIIEETEGTRKSIMQTYWTDAQLLRYMSERSVGYQNKSSPFIFHIRENEFHYHSYEYIYKGDEYKIDEIHYGYHRVVNTKKDDEVKEIEDHDALDWLATTRNKFFLSIGGAGISAGGQDQQKGYIKKIKTGEEVYKENEQLASKLPATENDITESRFRYTGLRDIDEVEAIIKSDINYPLQNVLELEILLKGRANRKSCFVVPFQHRARLTGKESKYSGLYFIKKAIHVFQAGQYYNKLHLIRSSYDITSGSDELISTTRVRR